MASHFIRKPKQKCVSHVLSIKLLLPATWFDSQKGENKTIRIAMQKVLLNAKKIFPKQQENLDLIWTFKLMPAPKI